MNFNSKLLGCSVRKLSFINYITLLLLLTYLPHVFMGKHLKPIDKSDCSIYLYLNN